MPKPDDPGKPDDNPGHGLGDDRPGPPPDKPRPPRPPRPPGDRPVG